MRLRGTFVRGWEDEYMDGLGAGVVVPESEQSDATELTDASRSWR